MVISETSPTNPDNQLEHCENSLSPQRFQLTPHLTPPDRAHGRKDGESHDRKAILGRDIRRRLESLSGYTPDSEIRRDRHERIDDARSNTRHERVPFQVLDHCTYLTYVQVAVGIVHTDAGGPTGQSHPQGPRRAEMFVTLLTEEWSWTAGPCVLLVHHRHRLQTTRRRTTVRRILLIRRRYMVSNCASTNCSTHRASHFDTAIVVPNVRQRNVERSALLNTSRCPSDVPKKTKTRQV